MSRPSAKVLALLDELRHVGTLESPTCVGETSPDSRGPRITIHLKIEKSILQEARFQSFGCGYLIAAGSGLIDLAKGQTVDECLRITPEQLCIELGGLPEEKVFCAQLAVQVLREGLQRRPRPE